MPRLATRFIYLHHQSLIPNLDNLPLRIQCKEILKKTRVPSQATAKKTKTELASVGSYYKRHSPTPAFVTTPTSTSPQLTSTYVSWSIQGPLSNAQTYGQLPTSLIHLLFWPPGKASYQLNLTKSPPPILRTSPNPSPAMAPLNSSFLSTNPAILVCGQYIVHLTFSFVVFTAGRIIMGGCDGYWFKVAPSHNKQNCYLSKTILSKASLS